MAQLVRVPTSDAFSRPGHIHNEDFNYEIIYLWHKTLALLLKKCKSSKLSSKSKRSLKKAGIKRFC